MILDMHTEMTETENKGLELIHDLGDLSREVRWLSEGINSVHETTQLLTSPMDLRQVLQIVVETIAKVLKVDAAGLRLLNEETGELVLKATYNLSDKYIKKGPVTAAESELNRRALKGETIIVDDMRTDPHFQRYHDQVLEEGWISSLSIGLIHKGKGIGILRLYSRKLRSFPQTDIFLAQTVAAQSAVAIINARLYEESLRAERMALQMRLAGHVQRHLIPDSVPDISGLDLAGQYVPCYDVGGDFYDFILTNRNKLVLTIGDVMGKGMPASLAMASLRSSLRAYAEEIDDIGLVVSRENRMFCQDTELGEFATLFMSSLDIASWTLTYCNCGHEPPVLIRNSGREIIDLAEGGMVLGVQPYQKYETRQVVLQPGDMIVMYTDGLADAHNFQRETFGRGRVIESALASLDMPAEQAAKNMLWLMRKFTGLTERFDDTAIVVLKRL